MSPKESMIKTLQKWMLGDYGHDLPADHFKQEVDRLLLGLGEAGFVIVPKEPTEEIIEAGNWLHHRDGVACYRSMISAAAHCCPQESEQ